MRLTLFTFYLFISLATRGQNETTRYIGKHYGDHPNWEYFAETKIYKKADTIVYEEYRYDRDAIRTPKSYSHSHVIKMIADKKGFKLLNEAVTYSFGYSWSIRDRGDSLIDSSGKTYSKVSDQSLSFTSLEALQLYFKFNKPDPTLQLRFIYLDEAPLNRRQFIAKNLGEIKIAGLKTKVSDCYEVAVISLDSSNVGDAKLYLDKLTGNVVKKEYVVVEESSKTGTAKKSIANELIISPDYEIDLKSISSPTPNDYIEAASTAINKRQDYKSATRILEGALSKTFNQELINAQVTILKKTSSNNDVLNYIKKHLDNPAWQMMQTHLMARDFLREGNLEIAEELFQYNANKYPDNYVTLVGLARVFSMKGELIKAKELLQKALTLKVDEPNRARINENILRLSRGEKML
jgi:tetratricopeptide (TPR) repeat protein